MDGKINDYFKETMNFDAVQMIDHVTLESPIEIVNEIASAGWTMEWGPFPLLVEINHQQGYVCDAEGTVDQNTADLLCRKIPVPSSCSSCTPYFYDGAESWQTKGELEKKWHLIIFDYYLSTRFAWKQAIDCW